MKYPIGKNSTRIMELSNTGILDECTLQLIATELGITRERVRQIRNNLERRRLIAVSGFGRTR